MLLTPSISSLSFPRAAVLRRLLRSGYKSGADSRDKLMDHAEGSYWA